MPVDYVYSVSCLTMSDSEGRILSFESVPSFRPRRQRSIGVTRQKFCIAANFNSNGNPTAEADSQTIDTFYGYITEILDVSFSITSSSNNQTLSGRITLLQINWEYGLNLEGKTGLL